MHITQSLLANSVPGWTS